jgi:class 3 adenylate cyclase
MQFCEACGASLVARPPEDAGARKVVTIVFADLVGSTALHERLDAESARALTDRYYRALHAVVEAHGGRVVKLLGDGVMAAFGLPRVAEDDAIRAVRAAVAMQQAFRALAREHSAAVGAIGLRVAVNTGEVIVTAADDDVVGDPINVAARLQEPHLYDLDQLDAARACYETLAAAAATTPRSGVTHRAGGAVDAEGRSSGEKRTYLGSRAQRRCGLGREAREASGIRPVRRLFVRPSHETGVGSRTCRSSRSSSGS